ncbi:amino acid adenylation domain-containing protein [Nonomuraea maritima]|uniref:Amino acid adenylation domain-containing protein n=1 Tax=Nonomuraea maritima TaxID=683260 RepID=A0A1G9GZ17_9ACTN|nr:non-ribosomal peptide synthetase [Nonomuraea maritima]SDL05970.1 amino acid adenylation domain-containing protein [Nonomuraea maritima]
MSAPLDPAGGYELPASFAQERLWFLDQLEPGLAVYNIGFGTPVPPGCDAAEVTAALARVVGRHEILRTRLAARDGGLVQVVEPEVPIDLPVTDVRDEDELARVRAAEAAQAIALDRAPLWRARLIRTGGEADHLFFTVHHVAFDAASVAILQNEFLAALEGRESGLPELPIQYGDFAGWQRGQWERGKPADQLGYWRKQLGELPGPLRLSPRAPDQDVSRHSGGDVGFELPEQTVRACHELARKLRTTPFVVLLAGLKALLARLAGQADVVVGSPVGGRPLPELEPLIGNFVNTLLLRTDCAPEVSFGELVERARATVLDALDHDEVPYERLVEELRPDHAEGAGAPLHQIVFNLLPSLVTNGQLRNGTAKVDLLIDLAEVDGRIDGRIEYARALFDERWVLHFAERYRRLLDAALADPATPLDRLPILLPGEEERLLRAAAPAEPVAVTASVTDTFAAQVAARPDQVAVADAAGRTLTYAELDRRSSRLARHLAGTARPDTPIAILLDTDVDLAVAVLAVLKSGAAYLPLDLEHPQERLRHLIADSGATAVLTRSGLDVPSTDVPVVDLDADADLVAAHPDTPPDVIRHPDTLAYVIYTSGSTGLPKGVGVADRHLTAYVAGVTGLLGLAPGLRSSMLQPLTFDFGVTVFHGALLTGGTLYLVPRAQATDAAWVAEHLRDDRIDLLKITPSHLAALHTGVADLLPRRTLVLGGEASRWEWVRRLRALPGAPAVVNHYGPTETTVGVLALAGDQEPAGAGVVTPIGHPLPHAEAYILDENLGLVPDGVVGELCVGGVTVTRGYLGRPGQTAAAFVPDPFSGRAGARLYRTGDRARRLPGGAIEFLGRADHQVKIRGHRVEPGEVQAVLAAHPSVDDCVVVVTGEEEPALAAYVVGATPSAELRGYLAERLPDHMIPAHLVELPALPLAAHGKVDRSALPEPGAVSWPVREAPRGPVEELVAALFESVLQTGPVGRDDGFFALGGHSLLAIKLMGRLRKAFGSGLPPRALFESPTVAGLAARLAAVRGRGLDQVPPVTPVPRDGLLPASYAQRRLWFLDQLETDAAVYNTHICLRIKGLLDVGVLERALLALAERHEVLRSRFVQVDDEVLVSVRAEPVVPFEVVELPDARPFLLEAAGRRFDLTAEPPLRAHVVRHSARDHHLLVTVHHVVNDAWSAVLFARELGELYAALSEGRAAALPELPVQYADYAAWQRARVEGELRDTQLAYWRERLAGMPERLELPADRPRPALRDYQGANVPVTVPEQVVERLRTLGADENASLFMTMVACLAVALSRATGQDDIVVGTPVAERPRPELEPLIGCFLNTLVLRTDCSGDPTFRELIRQVRATTLDAFANAEVPFETLIEELRPERDLGATPLVQVLFSLEDADRPPVDAGGLSMAWRPVGTSTAKFDLTFYLRREPGGIGGILEYRTDLFDAATAERVAALYTEVLAAAAAGPEQRLSAAPALTAADTATIERWNATGAPEGFASLPELLARRVAATPDAPAVCDADGRWLTYAEFGGRVNALARVLRERGVRLGDVVGVCLPRGVDLVVAVHAVVAAGAAYLPLDPGHPDQRLAFMATDGGARVVITEEPDRFPGLVTTGPETAGDGEPLKLTIPPRAPAYLIYTSGSTGTPKGVLVSHEAIVNRLTWTDHAFTLTPGDRVMLKTTFTFDVSVWELFWPLIAGAGLVVAPPDAHRDPAALARLIARHDVTTIHFVPSMLDALLDEPVLDLPSVRRVICSGEALPAVLAARLHARLPGVELHNLYGPTEAAIEVTWHRCEPGETHTPIGAPIRGIRIEILDADLRRTPIGTPGELCIAGIGLAEGYAGRPGLTARQFAPDPYGPPGARLYRTGDLAKWLPGGEVDYLGRMDDQVKIRGMRVEPGEIESLLAEHPAVRTAVVQPVRGVLAAYVVPSGDVPPEPAELRALLHERLPDHMVPTTVTFLDELPTNANGKLDRSALPEPGAAAGPVREAPRGPVEDSVAALFESVLQTGPVGRDDGFFTLGGHSLLAIRMVTRLRAAFAIELPVRALFEAPTVAALAERITAARRTTAAPVPEVLPLPRGGLLPVSYGQRRLWFLDQLETGRAVYNTLVWLRLRGPLDVGVLERALLALAERHEVLRSRFVQVDDEVLVSVAAEPVVPFEVVELPDARPFLLEQAGRRFDLTAEPPLRAHVVRHSERDHQLLVTVHHVVNDAWSAVLFARELGELYAALSEGRAASLPELPVQYADYAAWQRARVEGELRDTQLAYWRERLAGMPERLELPASRPRPARRGHDGGNVPFMIPSEVSVRLRALGAEENASLFMVLLAAFAVLLSRHTGQRDISVGTPTTERPRPELEHLIGFFLNTLVLRTDCSGDPTFRELIQQARTTTLDAFANAEVPFEALVEDLQPRRDLGSTPLVQAMLSLEDTERPALRAGELDVEWVSANTTTAKFDLSLHLQRFPGQLGGIFEYRTDLFHADVIERVAEHFVALLAAAVDDPDAPVSGLSFFSRDVAAVEEWNATGTAREFVSLPDAVAARVAATPDAPAVCGPDGTWLTYAEFGGRVNALAGALRERGVRLGDVVGVCLPRGVDLVVAVHAVMAAGAAYLPLDPGDPGRRLAFMVTDSRARVVITEEPERFAGCDTVAPAAEGKPGRVPVPESAPAYVIYTSGSTGRPKGVVVPHRAIANRLVWMGEAFPLEPGDRVLHKTPFTFDVSVWELFWPLMSGAGLVVAAPNAHRDTSALIELIRRHEVTMVHFVPSMLEALLEEPVLDVPSLRRVVCSGEALPPSLAGRFSERIPHARLHNLYGPTEAAVDVSRHACVPGETRTPIGAPIRGIRLEVLDEDLRRVPLGAAGELCIAGVGLADGYVGRPALTARQFVPDPYGPPGSRLYRTGDLARWSADGEVDYLGRIDHQVKIRGMRVELGEVEAVLAGHPSVTAAVVRPYGGGLAAYVVGEPDAEELKGYLRAQLPEHMVPSWFTVLERLPVTANGKLDRAALPTPEAPAGVPYEEPSGAAEQAVAEVWAEVLDIAPPGAHDGFFALGGDSIRSLKIVARLRARGYTLKLEDVFIHQTVRELARAISLGDTDESTGSQAFGLLGSADLDRLKRRFRGGRR